MKNLFFAIVAIATFSGFSAQAQSTANKLVYYKSAHPVIEIELGNIMTTTTFYIKNDKGAVIKKGSVARNGKIAVNTAELKNGNYRFEICGVTQDFTIR